MDIGTPNKVYERLPKPDNKLFVDITWQIFNNLIIFGYHGKDKTGNHLWICKCLCGNPDEFLVRSGHIKNGHTTSCGCLQKLNPNIFKKKHSLRGTVEYNAWRTAKGHCYNKNNPKYKNYGGRGIVMCNEWLNDPEQFVKDMGIRPPNKTSIDRINVNGNYEPGNCRWADDFEQMNNRTINSYLTFNEKTQTVAQWSREVGISGTTISGRIRLGWSIEEALTLPLNSKRKSK